MCAKEEGFWRGREEHRVREQVHGLDCSDWRASMHRCGHRITSAAHTELALQLLMLTMLQACAPVSVSQRSTTCLTEPSRGGQSTLLVQCRATWLNDIDLYQRRCVVFMRLLRGTAGGTLGKR